MLLISGGSRTGSNRSTSPLSRMPVRQRNTMSTVPAMAPRWIPSAVVPPWVSAMSLSSASRMKRHPVRGIQPGQHPGMHDPTEAGAIRRALEKVVDGARQLVLRHLVGAAPHTAHKLPQRFARRPLVRRADEHPVNVEDRALEATGRDAPPSRLEPRLTVGGLLPQRCPYPGR